MCNWRKEYANVMGRNDLNSVKCCRLGSCLNERKCDLVVKVIPDRRRRRPAVSTFYLLSYISTSLQSFYAIVCTRG